MSFADKVKETIDNAPAAGFVNVNFGKLKVDVNVLEWKDIEGVRTPVRVPFTDDTKLRQGQDLELTIEIGISEFNPKLEFEYTRQVIVRKSSEDKKFLTDWSEIVEPSLIAVFGKDYASIITDKKKVIYVAAEHVDSLRPPKEGKKNFGVPKFIERYKNAAECAAAREERYGKKDEAAGGDEALGIPKSVMDQVRALSQSLGGNRKQLKKALDGKPFGNYDTDAIIEELDSEE